ncbi:hypothetical protein EWH23_14595 [Meiothermus sp. PNK-Is4]|nr:hypothetical protein DNA98_16875 [Meiothermus sp. Pnk-1]RYM31513.1 hypothetical protein EWH23_14595 [Meiothermus sp. PNK-Is4]
MGLLDAAGCKYTLRWLVRTGAQWDYLPHDFPPPTSRASRPGAGGIRALARPYGY